MGWTGPCLKSFLLELEGPLEFIQSVPQEETGQRDQAKATPLGSSWLRSELRTLDTQPQCRFLLTNHLGMRTQYTVSGFL